MQRFEDAQMRGCANRARIWREAVEHHGDLAFSGSGPAQLHQFANPVGQPVGAFPLDIHGAGVRPLRRGTPAKDHRVGRPVDLGDCDHHGGLDR